MATAGRVERIPRPSTRLPAGAVAMARRIVGYAALTGLCVSGAVIAAGAAGQRLYFFVPAEHGGYHGWLRGPFAGVGLTLDAIQGAHLLVAMSVCYVLVLACAGLLAVRVGLAAVVALHVLFFLAPPLFSADVFGYIGYARLSELYGVDIYAHGMAAAPNDSIRPFVLWHDIPSPYGPVFTVLSYPLAHVSVPLALWISKAVTALAGLACVALTWLIARQAGRDPYPAALFVGLNPLLLAYGVGGAHNDLLLVAVVLGGVALAGVDRERLAGAQLALAAGMKASAGLTLPFLLLGARQRRDVLIGALVACALVSAMAISLMGTHGFGFLAQLHGQQEIVATRSVPNQVGEILGFGGLTSGLRLAAAMFAAISVAWLLWRTYRGMDWVAAAGWATLAVLVGSAWLEPWYLIWALPLAAVSGSSRLRLATLALCAFVVVTRVRPYVL